MSAALSAREAGASVLVTTKSALGAGNTGRAQGGIQAALGDDDSAESHFEDTLAAGHHAARPELVRRLAEGGPGADRVARVARAWPSAATRAACACCAAAARPASACCRPGSAPAPRWCARCARPCARAAPRCGRPPASSSLAPDGDGWIATLAPGGNGARRRVHAETVVLAAGGGLRGEADALGLGSTNHPDATPEVLRMALELGAEGRELDSWQKHPTGSVWPEALAGYALPETTRGYGATLHDADGERFVDELAPRDVVAQGIVDAVDAGRGVAAPDGQMGVWLDTPAIDRENGQGFTADRLRYVHNRYLKAGIDITRERVLVYPVLHYRNGGLAIDDRAQTTLPGLFAAGEIAGGVHGSNRLMGNSLLDTVVYGRRAGRVRRGGVAMTTRTETATPAGAAAPDTGFLSLPGPSAEAAPGGHHPRHRQGPAPVGGRGHARVGGRVDRHRQARLGHLVRHAQPAREAGDLRGLRHPRGPRGHLLGDLLLPAEAGRLAALRELARPAPRGDLGRHDLDAPRPQAGAHRAPGPGLRGAQRGRLQGPRRP